MTLEEAKKQIQAQANAQWEEFKKTGSSLHQGFALGGEDALEILDEVDAEPVGNPDKMNLDNVIRNLESDEAVCRSHGEDDYYRGMADGYKLSIDALQGLSRKPEQLTLKELARELRKIFKFKYLTVAYDGERLHIELWSHKPSYVYENGNWFWYFMPYKMRGQAYFCSEDLIDDINLDEYMISSSSVDYSKCIVEVE